MLMLSNANAENTDKVPKMLGDEMNLRLDGYTKKGVS